MIRINLLPVRESRRLESVKRELAFGGLVAVVLLAACVAAFVLIQARVSDVKARNAVLEQEIKNLKAIVARVDEVDALKQELQKKLDVIGELKTNKKGPVHMMDELANATPEKLTITGLQERNRQLTMVGYAVSNEVISQFLSNLEQSDWFEDVYLIEIDSSEIDGYTVREFSVTARLVVSRKKAAEETG